MQTEAPAAEYLPAMQLPQSFELVLASEPEYAGTRFEEQRQLHLPQKHKATVTDSTLRVEMNALEEQADNAKARDLFWKPLSARDPPALECHRRLRPAALGDVHFNNRLGGSRAFLSPPPP